jgi:ABC-2 type transport system permease protein
MQKLLSIEWMKIKNYRTFWVLSSLFAVSVFGINYFVYYIKQATVSNNQQVNVIIGSPFDFPNVWQTVAYISSFLLFFPGLLIVTSVSNEFSFKTHRQNIIDGWSRTQFINVKIFLVFIIALVSSLLVFFAAILFGTLSGSTIAFEKIEFIGYFFVQCLSYGMVALLLSVLIRRSGLAIGIFFLYSYVIENMLGGIINFTFNKIKGMHGPGDYLPLNTTDNLIPFPFLRSIIKFSNEPSVYILLGLSAVYLMIYYFISYKKFTTADL